MAIGLQAACLYIDTVFQMLLHWINAKPTGKKFFCIFPGLHHAHTSYIPTLSPLPPPFLPNRGSFMNSFKANGSTQFSVFILPSSPLSLFPSFYALYRGRWYHPISLCINKLARVHSIYPTQYLSLPPRRLYFIFPTSLKVLTNEKRGGLPVVLFDRSCIKLYSRKFSNKLVQAPSCERHKTSPRTLFLLFANYNCFPIIL